MKSCNKVTFDVILAHKEHFDQKLIEIVQNLEKQNQALSAASARKDAKIQSLTHIMAAANKKIADMRCVNKTLQMEKKEADDLAVERHIKYTKKIKLNARRHNVKFRSIQII